MWARASRSCGTGKDQSIRPGFNLFEIPPLLSFWPLRLCCSPHGTSEGARAYSDLI